MLRLFPFLLFLFWVLLPLNAQEKESEPGPMVSGKVDSLPSPIADSLVGNWEIDLRPDPEADPYLQEFRVTEVSGNNFQGFFYGSPVKQAKLNRNWDRLYFAFTSSDQTYDYFHSGYLLDGKLYGVSYCPGREFVQPWTGVAK